MTLASFRILNAALTLDRLTAAIPITRGCVERTSPVRGVARRIGAPMGGRDSSKDDGLGTKAAGAYAGSWGVWLPVEKAYSLTAMILLAPSKRQTAKVALAFVFGSARRRQSAD